VEVSVDGSTACATASRGEAKGKEERVVLLTEVQILAVVLWVAEHELAGRVVLRRDLRRVPMCDKRGQSAVITNKKDAEGERWEGGDTYQFTVTWSPEDQTVDSVGLVMSAVTA
jgi:hypothetical protein